MKGQAKVLVTGATGFVGKAMLVRLLEHESYAMTVTLRRAACFNGCATNIVGDLTTHTDWSTALVGQ